MILLYHKSKESQKENNSGGKNHLHHRIVKKILKSAVAKWVEVCYNVVKQLLQGGDFVLTSVYYYNHYRNFISRAPIAANSYGRRAWPAENIAPKNGFVGEKSGVGIILNRADTPRVIDFARALSTSIVSLKDASRLFVQDMNLVSTGAVTAYENHLRWVEDDLETFIRSYNNVQHLSAAGIRNPELSGLAYYFRNFAETNSGILSHLGVITQSESGLTYHGIGNMPDRESARDAVNTFKSAYAVAREFLEHPLVHHMEFCDLSYYYNYSIGRNTDNTLSIVQAGLLVDVFL